MGSGSLERAFASLVLSNMSVRTSMTNDTATLVCLNMTTPPLGKRNAYRGDWICAEYGPESGRKCRVHFWPYSSASVTAHACDTAADARRTSDPLVRAVWR